MNETNTGAPLTATVGERLGDDPHVREVREEVQRVSREPGAGAREGLGASRADRGSPRASRAAVRKGGAATGGRFPWRTIALAAVGWALARGIGHGLRRRARRITAGARRLALR